MTPILADLTLPHQIHLMHAQSPFGGGYQFAVSCNCTIHGPRSRYEPIEARALFPAAEAVAAWRAWHSERGVIV